MLKIYLRISTSKAYCTILQLTKSKKKNALLLSFHCFSIISDKVRSTYYGIRMLPFILRQFLWLICGSAEWMDWCVSSVKDISTKFCLVVDFSWFPCQPQLVITQPPHSPGTLTSGLCPREFGLRMHTWGPSMFETCTPLLWKWLRHGYSHKGVCLTFIVPTESSSSGTFNLNLAHSYHHPLSPLRSSFFFLRFTFCLCS